MGVRVPRARGQVKALDGQLMARARRLVTFGDQGPLELVRADLGGLRRMPWAVGDANVPVGLLRVLPFFPESGHGALSGGMRGSRGLALRLAEALPLALLVALFHHVDRLLCHEPDHADAPPP
jgi:hypothetical protein